MRRPSFLPRHGHTLPRVAQGDPTAAARALADMIPAAIDKAEALGAAEVVSHLRLALDVAQRLATEPQPDRAPDRGAPC